MFSSDRMLRMICRVVPRICDSTILIETEVGIKPINQILTSNYFNDMIIDNINNIGFERLISPPDFLKDEFTLIDKRINEWPQYELIKCLANDLPISDCSYLKRCRNGTLDFRKKFKVKEEWLNSVYRKKLNIINNGEIISIKVVLAYDDLYMVADGKHSLAMALYFDYRNLRFDILQNTLFDTYNRWIFKNINNKKDYEKHRIFFRRVYEHRKREINHIIKSGFDKQPD